MDAAEGADRDRSGAEGYRASAPQPGDEELAAIVRSVDEGQVGAVPVTVLVGGAPFSGDLISGALWWETMGQRARGTEGDDASEQFAAGADSISQLYRKADILKRRPVEYLHMQNVPADNSRIVGWRIRIEEVQAWRWGR